MNLVQNLLEQQKENYYSLKKDYDLLVIKYDES